MVTTDRESINLALDACRIDGGTQARVSLDAETVEDYASAIAAGAIFPPIVVFFDGAAYWIADGFHRLAAHDRAGARTIKADVIPGTRREALLCAVGANNAHGLRRTNADKRRAVELLLADPEWRLWSDREVAKRCGVGHAFVSEMRGSLSTMDSENPPARTYTTKHGTPATMHTERIGRAEPPPKPALGVHFSSETPEHYTPPRIVDAVIACLGTIDLDPCSNAGTPTIPAAQHFTVAENGLAHAWRGRVYMNPPYGREIDAWVAKLCDEHEHGEVLEAIALLPARTDTQWFRRLRDYYCCFVEGRLTFIGNDDPAPFPSAVFYLGNHNETFYRAFAEIGDVWQRIDPGMFAE